DGGDLVDRGQGRALAVEGVPGLEDHLVAGLAADGRRDVGMPAVVPGLRLLAQRPGRIDAYLMYRHLWMLHPRRERVKERDQRPERTVETSRLPPLSTARVSPP